MVTGFSVGLGFSCLSIVAMTALYIGLLFGNIRKSKICERLPVNVDREVFYGDEDPFFMYQL